MIEPTSLRYTPTHEWVHLDGDVATVGISKFAVDQLTDLTSIELPAVGSMVVAGKAFGVIESVKSANDLYAPVGGEVVEVNPRLAPADPKRVQPDFDLLARDPYTEGWLIKVKVGDPAAVAGLLDHDAYQKQVADSAH